MQPRFVGRLGVADGVTAANAAIGFGAAAVAPLAPSWAARLILLAAIADGLDGVLAGRFGGTDAGEYLDSLADVASFAVAPAVLVFAVARAEWGLALHLRGLAMVAVPALFVAVAVVRLAIFTAADTGNDSTVGVQTTLAATLLAAGYLAGVVEPAVLVGVTAGFCYLMVAPVAYPDLWPRDALVLGGLQALAVLFPRVIEGLFPRALLVAALAYLLLAPRFYWREP
jgi:CDP-diacylglycerol--serine O-phosphatidyltransferase